MKAYHVYTAFFFCVGIAGVYLLVRVGSRSRGGAWLAALSTATMSPTLLLLTDMRKDSGRLVPVRLGVLIRYGEGPHITALALIPIALAFAWLALEKRRAAWLVLASIFSAAVVSDNFYGPRRWRCFTRSWCGATGSRGAIAEFCSLYSRFRRWLTA